MEQLLDWNDFWLKFLAGLGALGGIGTIVGGIAAWLGNIWAKRIEVQYKAQFDAKLEELKSQFTIQLEGIKNRFLIEAKKREIQFGKLHDKRAGLIAELYSKLKAVYGSTALLVVLYKDRGHEKNLLEAQDVYDRSRELLSFFDQNRLYFSKELADKLDKVITDMNIPTGRYYLSLSDASPESPLDDSLVIKTMEGWQKKLIQLLDLLDHVEADFRNLLGSDEVSV